MIFPLRYEIMGKSVDAFENLLNIIFEVFHKAVPREVAFKKEENGCFNVMSFSMFLTAEKTQSQSHVAQD